MPWNRHDSNDSYTAQVQQTRNYFYKPAGQEYVERGIEETIESPSYPVTRYPDAVLYPTYTQNSYAGVATKEPAKFTDGMEPFGAFEVRRELESREISMIAIGGTIGTGIIIGSGTALARSGPAPLFISFIVMGVVCVAVMVALSEMSAMYPSRKGFASFGTRMVDPALGFSTAVVYLCKYLLITPNQIVAGSLVIGFWNTSINAVLWVFLLIIGVACVNLLGIRRFGLVEWWLSFIKLITLVGLLIVGLVIALGGAPNQDRLGFRYWKDGAAFREYKSDGHTGRFLGLFSALVQAFFAYSGTELIGVTLGESHNPRKVIPMAIRKAFYRILVLYISLSLIIGMIVDARSPLLLQSTPSTEDTEGLNPSASPFIVAISTAGIKLLPHVINAALLLFSFSAASSDLYIASRTLYGMARDGQAPSVFGYCTKDGLPYVSFIFCSLFMGLAFLVATSQSLTTFQYFVSATTIFGGLTWLSILVCFIAFYKAMQVQGYSRDALPYKAPFQPYLSYFALFMVSIIVIFKGFESFMPWDPRSFATHYIGIPVFLFAFFGYKYVYATSFIPSALVDLSTGGREFEDIHSYEDDEVSTSKIPFSERFMHYIKNW